MDRTQACYDYVINQQHFKCYAIESSQEFHNKIFILIVKGFNYHACTNIFFIFNDFSIYYLR